MGTHARIKPSTAIEKWDGWPNDVVGKLLGWNKGPNAPLSFRRIGVFECCGCAELCEAHRYGAAVLSGQPLCDDCLIAHARGQLALVTVALKEAN